MPIKDFIHHYPKALFNDIPRDRVGAYFYDIPGSGQFNTNFSRKEDLLVRCLFKRGDYYLTWLNIISHLYAYGDVCKLNNH